MKIIKTEDLKSLIPICYFETCLIDKATRKQITEMYPTREDGAYYLDKFSNHLKDNYGISLKSYIKDYGKVKYPKCPLSGEEVGFKISGKGVELSEYKRHAKGRTRENCKAFDEACKRFSEERKGEGNPMYNKESWNKGLTAENNDILKKVSDAHKGKKVSKETREKQSVSAKKRTVHGHTGKKHSEEAIQKMSTTIKVIKLEEPNQIFPAYKKAYERKDGINTVLVEYGDFYNGK